MDTAEPGVPFLDVPRLLELRDVARSDPASENLQIGSKMIEHLGADTVVPQGTRTCPYFQNAGVGAGAARQLRSVHPILWSSTDFTGQTCSPDEQRGS